MTEVFGFLVLSWALYFIMRLTPVRWAQGLTALCNIFFLFFIIPSPILSLIYIANAILLYLITRNPQKQKSFIIPAYVTLLIIFFVILKTFPFLTTELENQLIQHKVPIGLSYIFFISVSFLVDIYQEKITPPDKFIPFFSTMLFFPTMLIGPFVRYSDSIKKNYASFENGERVWQGFLTFCVGLFKVSMTRVLSLLVIGSVPISSESFSYRNPLVFLAYCMGYVYFNFSGYSDIVVGVCKMLGYDIKENFRFPFWSHSMSNFWSKWHITLSEWFRDYVFLPFSYFLISSPKFSRLPKSLLLFCSSLFSFFLIGMWHDLTPKFLLWSILNAIFVTFLNRSNSKRAYWYFTTLLCIQIIILLYLSRDLSVFFDFFRYLASPTIFVFSVDDGLLLAIISLIFLTGFYIEKLPLYKNLFPAIQATFAVILLVLSFVLDGTQVNSIYIGY